MQKPAIFCFPLGSLQGTYDDKKVLALRMSLG